MFFAHFGSSLCINSEMAREIGWQETKTCFFAVESTPNDQNRASEAWERVGREAGRMTSQIVQNVCLFGLCQVFER